MASNASDAAGVLYARGRRVYEWSRFRMSIGRGGLIASATALIAWITVGADGFAWLPLTFAVWTLVEWRGGALRHGGRYGLLAGLATFLLPMSLLRPCCHPGAVEMTGDCCTRPGACVAVGAILGLSAAWFLVCGPRQRRRETAAGMTLGLVSVVALKCAALFFGEAFGLLGGLLMGLVAASAVSAWMGRDVPSMPRS